MSFIAGVVSLTSITIIIVYPPTYLIIPQVYFWLRTIRHVIVLQVNRDFSEESVATRINPSHSNPLDLEMDLKKYLHRKAQGS